MVWDNEGVQHESPPTPGHRRRSVEASWRRGEPVLFALGATLEEMAALGAYCQGHGIRMEVFTDPAEALIAFGSSQPDLFLISDSSGPMSPWQVAEAVRRMGLGASLAVSTGSPDDPLLLRRASHLAVDLVPMPLSDPGASAGFRALAARAAKPIPSSVQFLGRLVLDPSAFRATACGEPLALTVKEFELLAVLMANTGKALDPRDLAAKAWGPSAPVRPDTVKVHMSRIRRKIASAANLETVRGIGYRLEPMPDPCSADSGKGMGDDHHRAGLDPDQTLHH
jgi:DNA-binding response OmpR family regulator